jgi:hypothetical protein
VEGLIKIYLLAGCLMSGFLFGEAFGAVADPVCLSRSELIALKNSRSLVAEAALALSLSAQGRTTKRFTATSLQEAAEDLENAKSDLSGEERIADLLDASLTAIRSHDLDSLLNIGSSLLSIEKANEQCS